MSSAGTNIDAHAELPSASAAATEGSVRDYLTLMKPRVMSLVVFTALVGMMAAPGPIHPVIAAIAILCIAVGAGASAALNMWYDADIDAVMTRTRMRPIPRGRVTGEQALAFGSVLALFSVMTLGLIVNIAAAALLALTIGYYVVIYTIWLKRRTPQNIVIGGAAGAFPPMIGWAAVTGTISLDSLVLFLIIFMWTPPHFWALALYRTEDYGRVGVPMLPVVAGSTATRRQILVYALILVPLGLVPGLIGLGGVVYTAVAAALGAGFLWLSWAVYRDRQGRNREAAARRLFGYSIVYLFGLFAALLSECLVRSIGQMPAVIG